MSRSAAACCQELLKNGEAGNAVSGKETNAKVTLNADLVIAGGGLGGCAAALAALRNGLSVILTEETDWIGGQISQQGVPPDEHQWIETHGATRAYRHFRTAVREYYQKNYPLTAEAKSRKNLNPGDGSVSKLCHEPRVTVAVLTDLLNPYLSSGKLTLLLEHKIVSADVKGSKVQSLTALNRRNKTQVTLTAPYFADATELGDLLPMTGTEYVTGAESKAQTGEFHAPEKADPENVQAFTVCYAIDYRPGENHVIEKPREYDFWKNYVPKMAKPWSGRLLDLSYSNPKTLEPKQLGFHPEGIATGDKLNLWLYRRIINKANFAPRHLRRRHNHRKLAAKRLHPRQPHQPQRKGFRQAFRARQATQPLAPLLAPNRSPAPRRRQRLARHPPPQRRDGHRRRPRQIPLRPRIPPHQGPFHHQRRTRRCRPAREHHRQAAGVKAATFEDSVGIGYYHIDLHPSTGGDNYIDFGSLPFQIPLGALLPVRMENILPANKNIGTTHITNGCFRLHPVEWSIGEAVGLLVGFALSRKVLPRGVRADKGLLAGFQGFVRGEGVELEWQG